jgi:anthranilate phosphoribosyltransferase
VSAVCEVTWPDVLAPLMAGHDLDAVRMSWAMEQILRGEATPTQIGAFAVALRAKGETIDEVEALVETMYRHATPFPAPTGIGRVVDVVGTGGDRANTVNISTMAALVVAGTGIPVVKHGNRAASSATGSADLLEALGVRLDLPVARVGEVLDEVGITFAFAPVFHPAMRFAGPPRREIGVPTTFNILGPLANPARPAAMAVGCADARLAPVMAGVLARRGVSALVFRGDDGLDELTTTTTSRAWVVVGDEVREHALDAADLGIPRAEPQDLRGGTPPENAAAARLVLGGEPGPVLDAVLLNAAAAVLAYEGIGGDVQDDLAGVVSAGLAAGLDRCRTAVEDGAVQALLERWVAAAR